MNIDGFRRTHLSDARLSGRPSLPKPLAVSLGVHAPFQTGIEIAKPVVFAHHRPTVRYLILDAICRAALLRNFLARTDRETFLRLVPKAQPGQKVTPKK